MGLNESRTEAARPAETRTAEAREPEARTHDPHTVRVDIGELVLDGFDSRIDPDRLSASFQAELARLVRERGVPLAADGSARELESLGGLPALPRTTSPARLGEELARAVHAGLSGRGEAGPRQSGRWRR